MESDLAEEAVSQSGMNLDAGDSTADDLVECAVCGELNSSSEDLCDKCGHHLYLVCPECERETKRILATCEICGAPLHKHVVVPPSQPILIKGRHITAAQMVMVLISGVAVYLLLARLVWP